MRSNDMNVATDDNWSAGMSRSFVRFRLRTLLAVAALVPVLIWVVTGFFRHQPEYRSWEDLRQRYDLTWLEVAAEPKGPGPFLFLGSVSGGRGAPVSGSFFGNGAGTKFAIAAHPDEAYRVVGLEPEDGSPPTFAVLRLRHVSATTNEHPVGQESAAK